MRPKFRQSGRRISRADHNFAPVWTRLDGVWEIWWDRRYRLVELAR